MLTQPNLLIFFNFFLDDKAAGKKNKLHFGEYSSTLPLMSMGAVHADSNVYEPADLQNIRTQARAQGSHHPQHTLIKRSSCQHCAKNTIAITLSGFLLSFEDLT